MFGIKEWRQTKFYQEIELETKLEIALRLLKVSLSVEQIAEALELEVEVVKKAVEKQDGEES